MHYLILSMISNVVCVVTIIILMMRRYGKLLILQHEKSFAAGWESGSEWVFEMPVSQYEVLRMRHLQAKERS